MSRLQPGMPIPEFTAVDHAGREVTRESLAGTGAILYFYPRAFTPGCTTESCDFRDRQRSLATGGYRVIGVSPDDPETLARFREEYDLGFDLWSDESHEMASAFGAWGIKKNYGKEYEGLIRSTFVVAADGQIESAHYNVKATGHADRIAQQVTNR